MKTNNKRGHTPGPWMVQNGKIVEQCYNGFTIADVKGATEVMQDDANAKLMAAAPELLALVKNVLAEQEGHGSHGDAELISAARVLIAKAEGK